MKPQIWELGNLLPSLCLFVGGVRLSLLGTSATIEPIVLAPDDKWVRGSRWNENWQGKQKYSEKSFRRATLSTGNPTWPDLGPNSAHRGGWSVCNAISDVINCQCRGWHGNMKIRGFSDVAACSLVDCYQRTGKDLPYGITSLTRVIFIVPNYMDQTFSWEAASNLANQVISRFGITRFITMFTKASTVPYSEPHYSSPSLSPSLWSILISSHLPIINKPTSYFQKAGSLLTGLENRD
jgi:hypothetical protein